MRKYGPAFLSVLKRPIVARVFERALPLLLLAVVVGCIDTGSAGFEPDTSFDVVDPDVARGPGGLIYRGEGIGGTCAADGQCRVGLSCDAGQCAAPGTTEEGDLCAVSAECSEGLVCDPLAATCTPAGTATAGQGCGTGAACAEGFRCELLGYAGVCVVDEGTGDVNAACDVDGDCLSPLVCGEAGFCALAAFGGISVGEGVECPRGQTDEGPFRLLFNLRGDEDPEEFFELPYPNDTLISSEGINLSGFYNPGSDVLGGDFVDPFVRAAGLGLEGFSPSSTVYIRFSRPFELNDVSGSGDDPTLFYRNITEGSPSYDRSPASWSWAMTTGRGRSICYNSVQVRASWNHPLREGDTWAVWITRDVRSSGDLPTLVEQDADFGVMMADAAPTDAGVRASWDSYAPLRDYFDREGIDPSTIAGAAVFTVGAPSTGMDALRDGVEASPPSSLESLTLCESGTESPCEIAGERGCVTESEDYLEIHGVYDAPVFQSGERPYLRPEDGGALNAPGGVVTAAGTESICVSMAIPKFAAMPESGWPVVLYAHGTGGSYTSHLQPSVAGALTTEADGGPFVSVSIDGAMHGPRRGDSTLDPDVLFFNPLNPVAARDNVRQGAADYLLLERVLAGLNIDDGDSPTGAAIRFDMDALHFYGHSQGATVGALYAAVSDRAQAVVLSGVGGSIVQSLLNKTSPFDIASAVRVALARWTNGLPNTDAVGDRDPFLTLVQQFTDVSDPLNYGPSIVRDGSGGTTGRDLLQVYGVGDTYTPPEAMAVFAQASRLAPLNPVLDDRVGSGSVDRPGSGNASGSTAIVAQYQPGDYDGHFVAFQNNGAIADIARFFASRQSDGTAAVE